jgi:hypothetical protein
VSLGRPRRIAFLAPRQGVLNIWVVDRGKPLSEARALTADRERPIRQHFWSADGEQVLYVQDKGGDENFLLYDVEVSSGKERKLTPFSGVQVQVVGDSLSHPDEIVVAMQVPKGADYVPGLEEALTKASTKAH